MSDDAPTQLDATRCRNCGAELGGAFCAACGQRRALPLDAPRVLREGIGQFLDADNAWWTTLRELTLRPGPTVRRYVAGERKRFVNPIFYMLTVATVFLFAFHALGVDIGGVQGATVEASAGLQILMGAIGYLVLVAALPVAGLMRLALRGHTVGELYVLLIYGYAQVALFQVLMYAAGAADSSAAFAASRFASAAVYAWLFAGYFQWRLLRALGAGALVYFLLSASLIACGAVVLTARAVFERLFGG
jgi:hypothetical protein